MELFKDEICYFVQNKKNHISFIGCKKCGWSVNHLNLEQEEEIEYSTNNYESTSDFSKRHYTCICKLFESSIICCSRGYENLLLAIPSIAFHSPVPLCSTENTFIVGTSDLAICISRSELNTLYEITKKAKLNAMNKYYQQQKFVKIDIVDKNI
jgi:hypothetical protein